MTLREMLTRYRQTYPSATNRDLHDRLDAAAPGAMVEVTADEWESLGLPRWRPVAPPRRITGNLLDRIMVAGWNRMESR
jgi:hypothetical protein